MRWSFSILLIILFSCKQEKKKSLHETMTGNWIVLYADDDRMPEEEADIYSEIGDSVTNLKCLKLLSFSPNGNFKQLDSGHLSGKWGTKDNQWVVINEGGKGFDRFKGEFIGNEDNDMQLVETIAKDGVKLEVTWHLEKIEEGEAAKLFDEENNDWRNRPSRPETDVQMKQRMAKMLQYYSNYFQLVSDKASYYIPARVMLPFEFHTYGLFVKKFDATGKFSRLFYDSLQAQRAHIRLDVAHDNTKYSFEPKGSYSAAFAKALQAIAVKLSD